MEKQMGESVCHSHDNAVNKAKKEMADNDTLHDVAELFKVLGDKTRIKILSALSSGELCVCGLASLLDMTVSAISHQLRILRHNQIVKSRRKGKEIYYTLSDERIINIFKMAIEHTEG